MNRHQRSLWVVYRAPLALALLSGAGLVLALLGDGAWDALSWPAVLSPVAVVGWAWIAR